MTDSIRIVSVVGARPQFIKVAAFERAIDAVVASGEDPPIEHHLVHTGQHYDPAMSADFFEELRLSQPLAHLGVGSASHGAQTGEMLRLLEPVLQELRPDVVVVFGDTNSTLAGALAAAKLQLPVAHVEAGLRSFRRDMPEEINRVVADHLSTILFCPSSVSVANLRAEGITEGVHLVGDLMYDALLSALPSEAEQRSILEAIGLAKRGYALATLHRAANTDDSFRLARTMKGLDLVCDAGLPVVLPMHPRTRARLTAVERPARVRVIEPVGYRRMLALAANARVILTDSGGVQKEALWLRGPLRHAPRRNRMAGDDRDGVEHVGLGRSSRDPRGRIRASLGVAARSCLRIGPSCGTDGRDPRRTSRDRRPLGGECWLKS